MASDHTCLLDCGWGCVNETENKVTSKFKAGDRVRLTGSEWEELGFGPHAVVTIVGVDEDGDPYFEDGVEGEEGRFYIFNNDQYSGELVTDHQGEYVSPDLSALAGGMTDVESAAIGLSKLAELGNKVQSDGGFAVGNHVRLTGSEWMDFGYDFGDVVEIEGVDAEGGAYFVHAGDRLYFTDDSTYSAELISEFADNVSVVTNDIASMLIAKNKAYGNSALDPIRTFSKANAREQLLVRIDDKLSRIARGHDFPNEDTIDDLIGYLVLLKIAGNDDD